MNHSTLVEKLLSRISFAALSMTDARNTVNCDKHGVVGKAFVCQHLAERLHNQEPPIGFFTPDEQNKEQPAAWCTACDQVLSREGEWNDASEQFAGVTLICTKCFTVLERNSPF